MKWRIRIDKFSDAAQDILIEDAVLAIDGNGAAFYEYVKVAEGFPPGTRLMAQFKEWVFIIKEPEDDNGK